MSTEAAGPRLGLAPLRLVAAPGTPLGAIFGGIGLAAAALVALFGLDRLPFTVCTFKALTGLPCPSCGSTRTLACLVHGDVAAAFAMNPLAAAGVFAVAVWALIDLALARNGRALSVELRPDVLRPARVAALLAIAVNWAYLILAGR